MYGSLSRGTPHATRRATVNDRRADLTEAPNPSSWSAPPRPVLVGLGVLAAMAVILLAVLLLQREPETVGEASPSPSTTSAATTEPTAPSASPSSTPEPTTIPDPALPERWTQAATFSEPDRRYVLGDLVAWSDGLVAVGTRYQNEARGVFGPPPPHTGRVWRSEDGTTRTDATPDGVFDDVELTHLFEAADGALILIGNVWTDVDPTSAAWETRDGEAWTPVTLDGLPTGGSVAHVATGARGLVASTYVGGAARHAYSADGRSWQPTLDEHTVVRAIAAGDEGFVAHFVQEGGISGVVASADGIEWVATTEPADGLVLVLPAPRGPDWFATTTTYGAAQQGKPAVRGWKSANGLDWTETGEIPSAKVEFADVVCFEVPAAVHGLPGLIILGTTLAGPCGEGAVIAAGGSYASLDGVEWTRLPFGEQAFAAGAVEIGGGVVVATDARTNRAETIGVTFWISDDR